MNNNIAHTVYLQDGKLCNLRKRVWRQAKSLLACFATIPDPRHKRGIRHSHALLLFILFSAITTGCTTLKDCHLWAIHNKRLLKRYFLLTHGIPDPTTFSYLLRILHPSELGKAYLLFLHILGVTLGDVFSADGKTMRGVGGGKETVRHILTLFSHLTHTALAQIGVSQKENEIPALRRMLTTDYCTERLQGCLLLADALHTNPETATVITKAQADYLLVVKGNQKDFFTAIMVAFAEEKDLPGTNYQATVLSRDSYTEKQQQRKRDILTMVTTTNDQELCAYLIKEHKFPHIQTVGVLKRKGMRISKDGTSTLVDETICFVSSRKLSAKQTMHLLRQHWCIENNLHWVKDFVFLEDRQTLRSGNAPQNMSFLRSMCISLCNLLKLQSISTAIHNFQKNTAIHYQFLRMASIV